MVRTQIQLTEEQARALKRLAAERGVSMAELVREGVDEVLHDVEGQRRWERLMSTAGIGRGGGGNVAEEHDRYLAEALMDWRSS